MDHTTTKSKEDLENMNVVEGDYHPEGDVLYMVDYESFVCSLFLDLGCFYHVCQHKGCFEDYVIWQV